METEKKILSVMDKYNMVSVGDTVILAVSGGADSMCLLHFFNTIWGIKNLNIICAHVNHGIRGKEADRDENFVRSFCEKNSIPFECAHFNVPGIAKETGESEEQCGRRLRYEFFASISENAKIATAHNLNDCQETFIFNLARGTGLKGLTGIPPVRDNIIRPLIECTREEIEEYLRENGVDFITDSTNLSDEYSRNKIRHTVIPVLNEINGGFPSVFLNCISALSDAENYLAEVTDDAFEKSKTDDGFSVSDIESLDKAIKDRVIIKIAEYYGARDISFKHVSLINNIMKSSGAVMLTGDVTVASDGKKLFKAEKIPPECEIYVPLESGKTEYTFPLCKIKFETIDKNELSIYNINKLPFLGCGDADKIVGAVFRTRKSGDRFKYPNAEHSKSLKNLFKEKNITPALRYGIPMLADENNILWINGVGVSDHARITSQTKNIFRITVSVNGGD